MQHHLGISFPHEDSFNKVKNSYMCKCGNYSICDDYVVNPDEMCMNGDWFYTTKDGNGNYGKYDNFGDGEKCRQR